MVEQSPSGPVERHSVMLAPADVETDEHVDFVKSVDPGDHFVLRFIRGGAPRHPRYERPRACSGPARISDHPPPTRSGGSPARP